MERRIARRGLLRRPVQLPIPASASPTYHWARRQSRPLVHRGSHQVPLARSTRRSAKTSSSCCHCARRAIEMPVFGTLAMLAERPQACVRAFVTGGWTTMGEGEARPSAGCGSLLASALIGWGRAISSPQGGSHCALGQLECSASSTSASAFGSCSRACDRSGRTRHWRQVGVHVGPFEETDRRSSPADRASRASSSSRPPGARAWQSA